MCELMETLRWDFLAEGRAEGVAEGVAEGRAEGRAEGLAEGRETTWCESVQNLMHETGWTSERAMDVLRVPTDVRPRILKAI